MNSHGHIHIKDNLELLEQIEDESIDLICTNPPFYQQYGRPVPEGLNTQVSNLKNTWTQIEISTEWKSRIQRDSYELSAILDSIRTVHSRQLYNYLVFLTVRLIEMRRILCREGSIFLHCGSGYSHYVRICMDCIFRKDRFQNEIIRCYAGRGTRKNQGHFQRKHDIVLFYSKSNQHRFYRDTALRSRVSYNCPQSIGVDLQSSFISSLESEDVGRVLREDWWLIGPPSSSEQTSYPNQKSRPIYRQIIRATTKEEHVVLDPFMGSGTVCVEAASLHRKWIGVDATNEATQKLVARLESELIWPVSIVEHEDSHFEVKCRCLFCE